MITFVLLTYVLSVTFCCMNGTYSSLNITQQRIQKSVNKEQSRNNKEVKRASIVRYNDVSDESSLIRVYELSTINV